MTGDRAPWQSVMWPNYGTPPLTLVRGQGCQVWDEGGRAYTDLLAGVAVNVLGHAHPALVAAVQNQVASLTHTSNLYGNEPALRLATRLQSLTGGHQVLLVNSGTEANEAALKLVRRYAHHEGREDGVVLAFNGSFHGRTLGSLALTGQHQYHAGFHPLPGNTVHVPFNEPAALEAAFDQHDVVGVFAEFVQGEGGVHPMTSDTAATMSRLCRNHGALLVADEVQTGVARTGRFLAQDHFGIRADVTTLAKGLGGGMPIGAVLAHPELANHMGPGTHGCTFGGNPVSASAANAVLDVVLGEHLADRAAALGTRLGEAFLDAGLDWRGLGLLMGLPLRGVPAANLVQSLRHEGFLVGQAGSDVLRLAPPLVIGEPELLRVVEPMARLMAANVVT